MSKTLETAREGLTRAGAACSLSTLKKLNSALNYLWIGHWMKSRGFHVLQRVDSREQVFEVAAKDIAHRQVLYLEFGVYYGDSMRTWSGLLRNPHSRLHGFDSFQGLPESWDLIAGKGAFASGGAIPAIGDPRVSFFKGLFHETLPRYAPPPHERLFVNLDADLYSSTKTVLDFLKPHISPGTYLYFDEFQSREHEPKAFDEFLTETGWNFRLVAANRGLSSVLFQRMPDR
ncbi:MAG TPA: TylF/MycF/NovP-related O-methyltransferase [Bryobacteraceae bacterium]|nr:TylF/MycF/NovP-related O-methyltransferase [Bryobacteraceae bacterium]